jgi:Ca-activated chloride channel homolog
MTRLRIKWAMLLLALTAGIGPGSHSRLRCQEMGALIQRYAASQADPLQPTTIRVQSNLVRVPVSVTDLSGRAVLDLSPEDFRIEENGRQEPLARLAEPGLTPLELALLLDISGSVRPRFEFERLAATRFLRRILRAEDTLTILAIGPQPDLIQPRTVDLDQALRSLGSMMPTQGATAFYDAVVAAAHLLRQKRAPESRRVQVILSDGEDNNSDSFGFQEMVLEVQQSDCIIYSINPAGRSIRLNQVSVEGQNMMSTLAIQTGGTAFLTDTDAELDSIFERIAAELRAQYLLEYYSSDQRGNGDFRQIVVSLPNRPGLRIRARQGYFAARG